MVIPRGLPGRNEGLSWGCNAGALEDWGEAAQEQGQVLGLTVSRQVEDQVDHKGDEYAGHQYVDDVEEWLAAYDEVEGDILVAGTVQWGTGVHVDPGWPVHYLPLPIL